MNNVNVEFSSNPPTQPRRDLRGPGIIVPVLPMLVLPFEAGAIFRRRPIP